MLLLQPCNNYKYKIANSHTLIISRDTIYWPNTNQLISFRFIIWGTFIALIKVVLSSGFYREARNDFNLNKEVS